jgi:surfeit locus 1 family protein
MLRRLPSLLLGLAVLVGIAGFIALGLWQLDRRAWKLDLIARVDARLAAAPVAAPGVADWPRISAERDEYARVRVTGRYLHEQEVTVQAVTQRGPGYWVLTPLRTPDFTLLVNRGFVPLDRRAPATRPEGQIPGEVTVTGPLRLSEPGGGFLRSNDAAAERWYSRDVAAIARAKDLGQVAPYFMDADAAANPGGLPIGGLTVIVFKNTHLIYAITWFALAGILAATAIVARLNGRSSTKAAMRVGSAKRPTV